MSLQVYKSMWCNDRHLLSLILVTQAKYLNLISALPFDIWIGIFITYIAVNLAAVLISHLEVCTELQCNMSQKWKRTMSMPMYVLGIIFPQGPPQTTMERYASISTLTLFTATYGLLIAQIFNSNLLACLMAVGRNFKIIIDIVHSSFYFIHRIWKTNWFGPRPCR